MHMFLMNLVLILARFGENLRSEQWLSLLDLLRLWRLWEPSAPIIVSACGSEVLDWKSHGGNPQQMMFVYSRVTNKNI